MPIIKFQILSRQNFRRFFFYFHFLHCDGACAFEDLAETLFFESWLNNKKNMYFFLPKFIKNFLFRCNGLKKKYIITKCLKLSCFTPKPYGFNSKTLWIQFLKDLPPPPSNNPNIYGGLHEPPHTKSDKLDCKAGG